MSSFHLKDYLRLLIEIGMGIDLIGGDDNEAVERAVNDIIHRVCIPYFEEKGVSFREAVLVVDLYTPHPDKVEDRLITNILPVKPRELIIRKHRGGALIPGLYGDIVVAIVSITIYVPERNMS